MIKIIHSADMHIRHDTASLSALKNLINEANQRDTDVLLISGDLFDTPFPEKELAMEVISILEKCHSQVFISPGNHDPFVAGSVYDIYEFPENVYIFKSSEVKHVRARCGADIYGYAFTSHSEGRHPLAEISDKNRISIYSIHADLGATGSNYAPLSQTDIELTKADYVALGHIHKRTEILKAGNTKFSYCGSLLSRDFGECGKKGAIYGEFEKENGICSASFEFLPISKGHFEELTVKVSDIENEDELISKVIQTISSNGYDKNTSLRITLKGELSQDIHPSSMLFKPAEDRLTLLEIINKTTEKISRRDLENDKTIRGEVYKVLTGMMQSEDEEKQAAQMALRLVFAALRNEDLEDILETEADDL